MAKLQNKKDIQIVALIFAVTYMVSYITRINYGAVISEMVKDTGFTKSALSVPLTLSCITYGAGQIVSGICGFHSYRRCSAGVWYSVYSDCIKAVLEGI